MKVLLSAENIPFPSGHDEEHPNDRDVADRKASKPRGRGLNARPIYFYGFHSKSGFRRKVPQDEDETAIRF